MLTQLLLNLALIVSGALRGVAGIVVRWRHFRWSVSRAEQK